MVVRAVFVFLAMVSSLTACSSGTTPTSSPSPEPTPIERLNTDAIRIPRIDFCSFIAKDDVRDALAVDKATKLEAEAWTNGDKAPVTAQVQDVIAEHLCQWTADESVVRAWVFAPPVTPKFARQVVAAQRRTEKCRVEPGSTFGKPSVHQICNTTTRRVRREGLFTDTWLGCEVSGSASLAELRRRADRWCSSVVTTLNTTR